MSDAPEIPPVSLRKPGTGGEPSRPRTVQLATGALALSGVASLVAAVSLLGGRGWLTSEQKTANVKAISSAVSSASASAAKKHGGDVAPAISSASASAVKKYPTAGSSLHSEITQQQRGVVIETVLLAAVLAFLCFSVYRGRHWSRWGVVGFWALSSFTGTLVGVYSLVSITGTASASYRAPAFIAGLAMLVAAVLTLMKPSGDYFAAHRPPPREGMPERRGLFGPRPAGGARTSAAQRPAGTRANARTRPAAAAKSALTSSAATRGEAYVARQKAKKRASANAESVARGAELARNRAKASKSRRIES